MRVEIVLSHEAWKYLIYSGLDLRLNACIMVEKIPSCSDVLYKSQAVIAYKLVAICVYLSFKTQSSSTNNLFYKDKVECGHL